MPDSTTLETFLPTLTTLSLHSYWGEGGQLIQLILARLHSTLEMYYALYGYHGTSLSKALTCHIRYIC